MIRIPVSEEMLTIEKELVPNFNVKMENIALTHNINYIDATSFKNNFTYTDGHHLDKKSSLIFSEFISAKCICYSLLIFIFYRDFSFIKSKTRLFSDDGTSSKADRASRSASENHSFLAYATAKL